MNIYTPPDCTEAISLQALGISGVIRLDVYVHVIMQIISIIYQNLWFKFVYPKCLKTKQAVVDIFDNEDQTDSIHTSVRQAVSSWTPNLILKNPAGRE